MRVEQLTLEVRDESLTRLGQLTPEDGLTSFKATLRLNNVGTWELSIPETRPLADVLRLPGSGLIVTGPNGVILSGPTVAATLEKTSGSPIGTWQIRGVDDSVLLGERLAYPKPSTADVTAQDQAYDSVTSVRASTAMFGYVNRNLGPAAPVARRVTGLTNGTDSSLGSLISYDARFDIMGELLTKIASIDGLAFDIVQEGAGLKFKVWQPTDKTKDIRLDVENNTLQKSTFGYGYGKTRLIVAGQGEGTSRVFREVTTTASTNAESLWARRVESFMDQRQEAESAKLDQAGLAALADQATITSVDVVPTSDSTMRPLVDFNLGDRITVVVAGQEVSSTITQLALAITDLGVYLGVTVGNPVGVDFEAITAKRQTDQSQRVNALERAEGTSSMFGNIDGGTPLSNYGGTTPIDLGGI